MATSLFFQVEYEKLEGARGAKIDLGFNEVNLCGKFRSKFHDELVFNKHKTRNSFKCKFIHPLLAVNFIPAVDMMTPTALLATSLSLSFTMQWNMPYLPVPAVVGRVVCKPGHP